MAASMERAHVLVVLLAVVAVCAGVTSPYRRSLQMLPVILLDADVFRLPPGVNAPEQVHITQGDLNDRAMTMSWVTNGKHPGSSVMRYGLTADNLSLAAEGTVPFYNFGWSCRSPFIHHATLTGLDHDTTYHYAVGYSYNVRSFSFRALPRLSPNAPIMFGLIGELGQMYHSNDMLTHYQSSGANAVLFIGGLSYANDHPDHDNRRWDSWGRFVERSVTYHHVLMKHAPPAYSGSVLTSPLMSTTSG